MPCHLVGSVLKYLQGFTILPRPKCNIGRVDCFSANVEACDAYIHNIDSVQLDSVFLARDPSLQYSALRYSSFTEL